jgi:hypothetical protein
VSQQRVTVLIPRREDGARRDEIWSYVKSRWAGWDLHEGHHTDGPFNRSAAINQASRSAGDWDVAVIADSDSFVGEDQLQVAIDGCWSDGRMWLAYTEYGYLDWPMSDRIMAGYTGDWLPGVEFTMTNTCSSMVVVRRDVWNQCRGFDEGFRGWGFEDIAFSHSAQTFGGGLSRAPGRCWHLKHLPSIERSPQQDTVNRLRAERYHAVAYDKPAMRALIDELRADDPSAVGQDGP